MVCTDAEISSLVEDESLLNYAGKHSSDGGWSRRSRELQIETRSLASLFAAPEEEEEEEEEDYWSGVRSRAAPFRDISSIACEKRRPSSEGIGRVFGRGEFSRAPPSSISDKKLSGTAGI